MIWNNDNRSVPTFKQAIEANTKARLATASSPSALR
jgi:hypothetical protein